MRGLRSDAANRVEPPGTAEASQDGRTALRVWLRLLSSANLIERGIRRRLRRHFSTTLPRFDVLAQLHHAAGEGKGWLTMSELSRRLMVSNGNVTGLTERLVREGLVSRNTSPTDARTQLVRLTSAGTRALESMTPMHRCWIERMFAGLTPGETAALHELIGKLKESVETASREDGVQ